MNGIDYSVFYRILEIEADASMSDIEEAYQYLKQLYSEISPPIMPLMEEFSDEDRQGILDQLDEAYAQLKQKMTQPPKEEPPQLTQEPLVAMEAPKLVKELLGSEEDIPIVRGEDLKRIREEKNIHIHDLSMEINIPYKVLVNIEIENFSKLPESGYLRWCVVAFARSLSLDSKKTAEGYMKGYRQWQKLNAQ